MKKQLTKKYQKFCLKLSIYDRRVVEKLLKNAGPSGRLYRRALILRLLHLRQSPDQIAKELKVTSMTVRNIGHRYLKFGLSRALKDAPRPGKASVITAHQEKEIVALVCSTPPAERSRWTLSLLQKEVIRRKIIKSIGKETLRTFLHEAKVKPWLEKNVVHWGSDRRIYQKDGEHS